MVFNKLRVCLTDYHHLNTGITQAQQTGLHSYSEALTASTVERLRKLCTSCQPQEKASASHSAVVLLTLASGVTTFRIGYRISSNRLPYHLHHLEISSSNLTVTVVSPCDSVCASFLSLSILASCSRISASDLMPLQSLRYFIVVAISLMI